MKNVFRVNIRCQYIPLEYRLFLWYNVINGDLSEIKMYIRKIFITGDI